MHKSNEITTEQILMLVLVNSKEKSVVPFKDFEKWQVSSMLEDFTKLYNKHRPSKLCESTASKQSIAVLKWYYDGNF